MDIMETLLYRLAYWLYDWLPCNWFEEFFNLAEGLCVAGFILGLGTCALGLGTSTEIPNTPWWIFFTFLGGATLSILLLPLGMMLGDISKQVIEDMKDGRTLC